MNVHLTPAWLALFTTTVAFASVDELEPRASPYPEPRPVTDPYLPPTDVVAPAAIQSRPVTFFPPSTPPFELTAPPPTWTKLRELRAGIAAPARLAEFAGEFFYPALGTRLYDRSFSKSDDQDLTQYQIARDTLAAELMARVDGVAQEDTAARERALSKFAVEQTPKVVGLEGTAEKLRQKLVGGGLWRGSVNWDAQRTWHMDTIAKNRLTELRAEHHVIRAAAFYEPGLGIEQRELLRELMDELNRQVAEALIHRPTFRSTAVSFLPAPGTFHPPRRIPPELAKKIAAFTERKEALKTELDDVVVRMDSATAHKRRQAFEAMTRQQQPKWDDLEALAEEIRRDLASLPQPWLPPLPTRAAADPFQRSLRQCRIAMLEPGLSPAQRRLLFAVGTAGCGAPLPPAQMFFDFPL